MSTYNNHVNVLIGLLSAVGSLMLTTQVSTIFINWTAPFSFDIAGDPNLPDITYCVDVINCTSNLTLYSECGINMTEFSYSEPLYIGCNSYSFTVTPVNMVGNGTTKPTLWGAEASM